jgi:hypothetical protein
VTAHRTLFLCLRGVGYKHTVHTCRVSIFSLAIDRHTSLFVVAHIARSIVNHNSFEEDMQNSKTTIGRSHIAAISVYSDAFYARVFRYHQYRLLLLVASYSSSYIVSDHAHGAELTRNRHHTTSYATVEAKYAWIPDMCGRSGEYTVMRLHCTDLSKRFQHCCQLFLDFW